MSKYFVLLAAAIALLFSCRKRLDAFLFNQSVLTFYSLDAYSGEKCLDLGGLYTVPDSMIHRVSWAIQEEGKEVTVHGIYVGNLTEIATDTVLLFCHGNKDHMDFYWPRQKLFSHLGSLGRFGVLMFDYPGYGMSESKPTEANMYASTEGALQWLKNHGLSDDRLVMYGFSLGSAPVCEVAGNPDQFSLRPHKIVLEAPFASAEILVQDGGLLSMPGSFLVDLKIDNATEIKKVTVPLLWIHGEEDAFLTVKNHGQLVYDHKPDPKQHLLVPGGEHETTPYVLGYAEYLSRLLAFIEG